jgi:para-aminobenzoate synthetase / 4-amino-4-deoxychorismate lyase
LAEGGEITVTTTPMPPADPEAVMRFAISSSRVDSSDLFLFHKTTRRELYDREWQEHSERLGTDEVIYLNERGELAEGSRTTIFIERDGELLTPPLSAGLLPGTLRAELLAEGKAREVVLTPADLEAASVAVIYLMTVSSEATAPTFGLVTTAPPSIAAIKKANAATVSTAAMMISRDERRMRSAYESN